MAGIAGFFGVRRLAGTQGADKLAKLYDEARTRGFPTTRDQDYPPIAGPASDNRAADVMQGLDVIFRIARAEGSAKIMFENRWHKGSNLTQGGRRFDIGQVRSQDCRRAPLRRCPIFA